MGEQTARQKANVAPASPRLVEIEPEQQQGPLLSTAMIRRAQVNPRALSPGDVMRLQRAVGNQAVAQMLSGRKTPPVIQRAPMPRVTPPVPVRPGVRGGDGIIQRSLSVISNKTSSRVVSGPLQGTPKQQIKRIDKSKKGEKYKRFDSVEIEDDETLHIRDEENNIAWYKVKDAPNTYIQAAKTFFVNPKGGKTSDVELDEEGGIDSLLEFGGGLLNTVDDPLVEANRRLDIRESEGHEFTESETKTYSDTAFAEGAFWAGGSALGVASGILGMAASLKDLTSDESSAWDKVESAFNLIASGAETAGSISGVMGGVSSIISGASEEGSSLSDTAGAISTWSFGYQSMFGSIASGVKTVLGVVKLVRMVAESIKDKSSHNTEEYMEQVAGLIVNGLETAKGVVMTVRTIYEAVEDVVTTAFENVFPGLDIAISAIKIISNGYHLVKSAWRWITMMRRQRGLKKELKQQGYHKSGIKDARKFYSARDAELANVSHKEKKYNKSIEKRYDKIKYMPITGSQKKLEKRLAKTYKLGEEIDELKGKKKVLGGRKDEIKKQRDEYEMEVEEDDEGSEYQAHPSRMELSELNLAGEIGAINRKRVIRDAIHIATSLVRIAGSIVTIVGGQGAPAGLALKAVAAGVDISLPFLRSIKQFGRNVAAKNQVKGEKGISGHIFNPNKSSAAKLANRKKQAVAILLMVANLNKLAPKSTNPKTQKAELKRLKAAASRVEGYISAVGCSPKKLYKANGNPGKQVAILVTAMSKREFSFD